MKKLILPSVLLLAAAVCWAAPAVADDEKQEAKHEFVGATKCKICHKPVYKAWLESGHAKTFDALTDEEKKKKECIGCHITGQAAEGELLGGVQCEACHGPGSDYKSPKIMSKKKWTADREAAKEAAIEAGLVYPTEENCKRCHKKEGNPNYKPFDFAKMQPLVHKVVADTAEKE